MEFTADPVIFEPRIKQLVAEYASNPPDTTIPRACAPVMNAVTGQALRSSEGGKRLRALLTLASYDAAEKQPDTDRNRTVRQAVIDMACAIEVFQTAALVHDDIIDDSDLRRGKPSAHRALKDVTADQSRADSIGKGLGIMLGDLLATASVAIARNAANSLNKSQAAMRAFLTMHREVEIGQILDLATEEVPLDKPEMLARTSLNVFRWKTASYTTIAPLELGLIAAGVNPTKARAIAESIGVSLGLAFQLADDLLDVVGSSASTGKPVGGDIREGKRTVLLADALSAASERDRDELIRMFESPERTHDDVEHAIGLFHETGAIDHSRERIATLWHASCGAIDEAAGQLGLDQASHDRLFAACARFIPSQLAHRSPRTA